MEPQVSGLEIALHKGEADINTIMAETRKIFNERFHGNAEDPVDIIRKLHYVRDEVQQQSEKCSAITEEMVKSTDEAGAASRQLQTGRESMHTLLELCRASLINDSCLDVPRTPNATGKATSCLFEKPPAIKYA